MKPLGTTKQLFFALLRNALWHSQEDLPCELSEKMAGRILGGADVQAVSGLIVDALIRNEVKILQDMLFEAIGLQEQVKQENLLINKGVKELLQLFSEYSIDYAIVKGQAVASYYLEPLARQSGDIDYYCDSKNFPKSQQAIKDAWGIQDEATGSEFHVHFDHHGVIYEGHFSLVSLYHKDKISYWQQLLDEDKGVMVTVGDVEVKTLSPTLHALYVFLHLYYHLMELGIGLRQFCDMAVMLHYCKNDIDQQQLRKHLEVLGMERTYRACGSILVDCLGLPESELGYALSDTDRCYGGKILDVVFYRGNMGHYNKRNGFRGWKHKLEATCIKTSHFLKFMPLAPDYSCRWLWHEFWRKAL